MSGTTSYMLGAATNYSEFSEEKIE